MNPEAQRIALAESQGISIAEETDGSGLWSAHGSPFCGYRTGLSFEHAQRVCLPRYLTDLNAIHAAAKAECEKRGWGYSVVYSRGRYIATIRTDDAIVDASEPDQCAALSEALLRAMNLWTEQPNQ